MNLRRLCVFVLLGAVATVGIRMRLDDMAIRDSMMVKGSLMGQRWLEKNGFEDYLTRQSWKPTQGSGLECVGRWSYGPSLKVSLRVTSGDTVICLTRGSGATLARFRSQDSATFDLLGDLNFAGIPRRAIITDTLVVAGIHVGGTGLEVHGVSNPAQPNLLSRVDLPVVNDIAVKDSFVYAACEDDTLRIYNIADPRQPVLVGACRDSCDLFMTQAGNYCYLVHVSGVNIVDVSNPTSPRRAGHIGGEPLAVYVRDTLCYDLIFGEGLRIYNVKNVASPHLLGWLTLGDAMDLTMPSTEDTLLYTSLLDVVKVSNPASPSLVGHIDIPAEYEYGVAVVPAANHALVANYTDGVVAVDVTNPTNPAFDTTAFGAGSVLDIYVDGTRAYLATPQNGMAILDVSDATRPSRLGGVDIVGLNPECRSVAARDSFAYMHWYQRPQFQAVDVSDPTRPQRVAGVDVTNPPEDMVIRDSFVYVAEINKLQIVNVARPREPLLVGTCSGSGDGVAVVVQDSFAYMAADAIRIINIARPDSPFVVSTIADHVATGLAVRDTFLYIPYVYDTLFTYSVADAAQPRLLTFTQLGVWPEDIVLGVGRAYVALVGGQSVEVLDLTDPGAPVSRGQTTAPFYVGRLFYNKGLVYAAMGEAGVAIYETTAVGITEQDKMTERNGVFRVWPSVTGDGAHFAVGVAVRLADVSVFDVSGKRLKDVLLQVNTKGGANEGSIDLSGLAAGLYVVRVRSEGKSFMAKVVKTNRR